MSMFPIYLTLKKYPSHGQGTSRGSQTQRSLSRSLSRGLKSSSPLSSCKSKVAATTGTIHSLFSIAASTSAVEDASPTIKHSVDARITAAVTSITTCSSVLVAVIILGPTYPISSVVTVGEIVAVDPTMVTIVSQAIVVLVMFILK